MQTLEVQHSFHVLPLGEGYAVIHCTRTVELIGLQEVVGPITERQRHQFKTAVEAEAHKLKLEAQFTKTKANSGKP